MQIAPESNRLIRLPRVIDLTGKARTQIDDAIRKGNFPAPIKEGRLTLWVESEVQAWIADRIANAPRKA